MHDWNLANKQNLQGVPPAGSFIGDGKGDYWNHDRRENMKLNGVLKTGYLMRMNNGSSSSMQFSRNGKGIFVITVFHAYIFHINS